MKFLSLCSGIGGADLGLERAGMTCVGQVEIDDYCKKILAKHWPQVPRWGDIKTLPLHELPTVDCIWASVPCQPFSLAANAPGQGKGVEDDRHLWPYALRVIQYLRPSWFVFENVPGIITKGLDLVLSDLENEGYSWRAYIIPALAVGLPHHRERVWCIAHADSGRRPGLGDEDKQRDRSEAMAPAEDQQVSELPANPDRRRRKGRCSSLRGSDGVPQILDSVRALGNAVVPQIAEKIGRAILCTKGTI